LSIVNWFALENGSFSAPNGPSFPAHHGFSLATPRFVVAEQPGLASAMAFPSVIFWLNRRSGPKVQSFGLFADDTALLLPSHSSYATLYTVLMRGFPAAASAPGRGLFGRVGGVWPPSSGIGSRCGILNSGRALASPAGTLSIA
jgi:hypothetical protein